MTMKVNKLLVIITLLLLPKELAAQSDFVITGHIDVPEGDPQANGLCLYSFNDTRKIYKIRSGDVEITVPETKDCLFEFVFDSYQSVIVRDSDLIQYDDTRWKLPIIALTRVEQLNAAGITANNGHITIDGNRICYDVASDESAKGKSLQTLLNKLPFIQVDAARGSVSMADGSSVKFSMNGKRSLLLTDDNYNYISSILQGKHLKSITLDIEPGGEYTHEAAVINIDTAGNLPDLIAGVAMLTATTKTNAVPAAFITTKIGKIVVDGYYNFNYSNLKPQYSINDWLYDNGNVFSNRDTTDQKYNLIHTAGLSTSYDISPSDVLFASVSGAIGHSATSFSSDYVSASTELSGDSRTHNKSTDGKASVALQHSFASSNHKLLTLQYDIDAGLNEINLTGDRISENTSIKREQKASADYSSIVNDKFSWYARALVLSRHNKSESYYFQALDYKQSIATANVNIKWRPDRKFTVLGDISFDRLKDRADIEANKKAIERTDNAVYYMIKANWFPAVGHNITATVARDVFRPEADWLNPYRDESVEGIISTGNPFLEDQKTYKTEIKYRFFKGSKFSITPSIEYRWSNNGLYAIKSSLDDGRMLYTYGNVGKTRQLFNTISVMYKPNKSVTLSLHEKIVHHRFFDGAEKNSYWDNRFSASAQTKIWQGGVAGVTLRYMTPPAGKNTIVQATHLDYRLTGDFSIIQRLGDKWRLEFDVGTPWKAKFRDTRDLKGDGFKMHSLSILPERIFGIMVNYSFGRLKETVKTNTREVHVNDHKREE